MTITIDDTTYDVPLKVVNRKAEILYKYAERLENGDLQSEILAVYYNYDLECGMSSNNITDYANLWIKLTEPTEVHEITLPDETSDGLTFNCYFANIRDEVVKWRTAQSYFRNLSFSVIATSPARTPE